MKTNTRESICYLTVYVLLFLLIFLLQSCTSTSTSVMRLEGDDFKENLPGKWEGKSSWASLSITERINIIKIVGDKVHLTGYMEGIESFGPSDEVYGRIENSTLLLTWPLGGGGIEEKYKMNRDDSNNLTLDGHWKSSVVRGTGHLKKIE